MIFILRYRDNASMEYSLGLLKLEADIANIIGAGIRDAGPVR